MADRFNNISNTAPVLEALKNKKIDVPRSKFDYSRTWFGNAWFGALLPIDLIKTLPGEDYDLNYDIMIETSNPLSKKLMNGWRAYVHSYYMTCNDLWEGSENYFDKGRSGNINLKKPTLSPPKEYVDTSGMDLFVNTFTGLLSLSDFFGLPVRSYKVCPPNYEGGMIDLLGSKSSFLWNLFVSPDGSYVDTVTNNNISAIENIDALPFAMYQSIYLDFYANSNLLQNNKFLYPDNVKKRILSYDTEGAFFFSYDQQSAFTELSRVLSELENQSGDAADSYYWQPSGMYYVPSDNSGPLWLTALRYRQWKGDIFNTAMPFPNLIRGDVPTITLNDVIGSIDFSDSLGDVTSNSLNSETTHYLGVYPSVDGPTADTTGGIFTFTGNTFNQKSSADTQLLLDSLNKAKINVQNIAKINLNQLRALEVYTLFAERMARTDGSYNEMIKAQFGYSPNVHEYRAKYIGGFYQDIYTSDVTAQSSSDSLPLGSVASKGLSVHSGNIGHCFSKDYGYIMTILSIVPDCVYTSNLDKHWSEITQDMEYFPLLNNLSPQMILNKEVLYSGSEDVLNDGFGWTERFQQYKARQNKATGLIGFPSDEDNPPPTYYEFANRLQRRIIPRGENGQPKLNNEFVTMSPSSIDMSVFSVPSMVPFVVTAHSRVSKVSPMPYITQPEGLSPRS